MQTMAELLHRLFSRIDLARSLDCSTDVVRFSPEDERTLTVDLWQRRSTAGSHYSYPPPPDIRDELKTFAGMTVEWDSADTVVRSFTAEEKAALQERLRPAAPRALAEIAPAQESSNLADWAGHPPLGREMEIRGIFMRIVSISCTSSKLTSIMLDGSGLTSPQIRQLRQLAAEPGPHIGPASCQVLITLPDPSVPDIAIEQFPVNALLVRS